jgi:N-acetylglutamate synthase-like GNAT family acetyltransferase
MTAISGGIGDCAMYGMMDIAVHPRYQGRGVVRDLVRLGIIKGAKENVPIELSTTLTESELCNKLGFKKMRVWRWKSSIENV